MKDERLLDDLPQKFDGWLWKDEKIIPRNEITGFVGHDGMGKSTFMLGLVAGLTRGEVSGKQEKVFLSMREDGDAITRARLEEAGAEPWLCTFQPGVEDSHAGYWTFPSSLDEFEDHLISHPDISVAVFDSLDIHVDSLAGQKARQTLDRLHGVIQRHGVTVIFIGHFNKYAKEIDTAIGGGRGIKAAFRCTLVWGEKPQMYLGSPAKPEDEDDSEAMERYEAAQAQLEDFQDGTHVLAVHKNSYGKKYPMKLSKLYQAVERPLPTDPDETILVFDQVTEWLVSPQQVFKPAMGQGGGAPQTLRGNCKDLMLQVLIVAGDWMPADELNSILDKAEFSHDTRQKARRELQAEGLIERKKEGRVGWQWRAVQMDIPTIPESE